jgi:hypothetical protein
MQWKPLMIADDEHQRAQLVWELEQPFVGTAR